MEWCPALFWSAKGANFAVIKTGAKRYRPIFYYHPETQLGTGTDAYDEIGDAVIGVLQVEADHVRKTKIRIDETPAKPADAAPDKPDLSPLFLGRLIICYIQTNEVGRHLWQKTNPKNAFYAQSGGVTAVINASAAGVLETARKCPKKIGKVYAGRNGIIGALTEDLIDTGKESVAAIKALRHTPSGAFGSCRYKLKSLGGQQARSTTG